MKTEEILNNYTPIPYSGCYIWEGYLSPKGYGHVRYHGRAHHAHRLVYEFTKGPTPDGMVVCHKCDTPSCINPDHLWLGTQQDNIADCVMKGRHSRGSKNGTVKLTEEQVLEIRALLAGGVMHEDIAKRYGVSRGAITSINVGASWGWLE